MGDGLRNQADTHSGCHQVENRLKLARFRAYVEAESGPPAQPSHLIIKAGGELTWGQEECLPRQIAKGNMMFRGERMVLRKRYDQSFFQDYLGMRNEYVDMSEFIRSIEGEIYDKDEY